MYTDKPIISMVFSSSINYGRLDYLKEIPTLIIVFN